MVPRRAIQCLFLIWNDQNTDLEVDNTKLENLDILSKFSIFSTESCIGISRQFSLY